jgi:hypothetical protein
VCGNDWREECGEYYSVKDDVYKAKEEDSMVMHGLAERGRSGVVNETRRSNHQASSLPTSPRLQ